MNTWRRMINEEMARVGDPGHVVAEVVKKQRSSYRGHDGEPSLDRMFDDGYGLSEGDFFTVWTDARVYFPVVYDGAESVGSAPRNPCDEACEHVGGE